MLTSCFFQGGIALKDKKRPFGFPKPDNVVFKELGRLPVPVPGRKKEFKSIPSLILYIFNLSTLVFNVKSKLSKKCSEITSQSYILLSYIYSSSRLHSHTQHKNVKIN